MKVTSFEAEGDCLRLTIERDPGEHARVKIEGVELLIEAWKREPQTIDLSGLGGRVNRYPVGLNNPSAGRVVRAPDGSSRLILRDTTSAQTITAVLDNGDLAALNQPCVV